MISFKFQCNDFLKNLQFGFYSRGLICGPKSILQNLSNRFCESQYVNSSQTAKSVENVDDYQSCIGLGEDSSYLFNFACPYKITSAVILGSGITYWFVPAY